MKQYIDIKGVISKEDGSKFEEYEIDDIIDSFIEFVESKNLTFAGGFLPTGEDFIIG